MGGALGMAVLGSMGLAVYRSAFSAPEGLPPEAASIAGETLGGAMGVAVDLPQDAAGALLASARAAFTGGMQLSALVAAGMLGLAALLTAVTLRRLDADVASAGRART